MEPLPVDLYSVHLCVCVVSTLNYVMQENMAMCIGKSLCYVVVQVYTKVASYIGQLQIEQALHYKGYCCVCMYTHEI